MAYRRRYKRKTKSKRTKKWYDKKYSIGQMAKSAFNATRYFAKMINSEQMTFETTATSATNGNNSGTITTLSNIAVGDTFATRTGNSILTRSLNFKATITQGSAATQTFMKMYLLQDKQQLTDSYPTVNEVLNTNVTGTALASIASFNPGTAGRFNILKKYQFTLNSAGKTAHVIDDFIPMSFHIRYNGSSATDIQKNGIYLLYISNEPNTTGYAPTINYIATLKYHDN